VWPEYGGGIAVISFRLCTVKLFAATPPNVTEVTPVKPDPSMVSRRGWYSAPP
jgi:hypothetical protein